MLFPECARPERLATEAPGTTRDATILAAGGLALQPALLDVLMVAVLLGVSRSHVRKLHDSGRLPRPVRLGRAVRWRRDEVVDWIAAGCPPRSRWEAEKGCR